MKCACDHWRRDDAESTSLALVVPPSRADARRGVSGRVVRATVTGKGGAIIEVKRAGVCTGVMELKPE